MIQKNENLNINAAKLSYICIQDLIYYINIEKNYCLCLFTYLYEEVFALMHNFIKHLNYKYTHKQLTDNLYLSDLLKYLYKFIWHCSQYQYMQTLQHHFYELMQSIFISSQLLHILIINFILVLSISQSFNNYNTILSVIDKFSKIIIFISE